MSRVACESGEGRMRSRKADATFVVLLSLVLLVGMNKIHGMVSEDESTAGGDLEYGMGVGARRMLSVEDIAAEAERRELLETETRRMLAATGYYISYGALSASRVSCPPRSGRSYYTRNCNSASGPVRPYSRGCSTITRCARDEI